MLLGAGGAARAIVTAMVKEKASKNYNCKQNSGKCK